MGVDALARWATTAPALAFDLTWTDGAALAFLSRLNSSGPTDAPVAL